MKGVARKNRVNLGNNFSTKGGSGVSPISLSFFGQNDFPLRRPPRGGGGSPNCAQEKFRQNSAIFH